MTDPVPVRKERIYLTGFMGSGKSTIGPILANSLGFNFVDIDKLIERREGKTVNEIFREHGEAHFRGLERSIITELSARPGLVISLGGGTITDPEIFTTIITSGILVYLKITPEQIYRRLHRRTDRPLLTDIGGEKLSEEALRQRIQSLFAAREPFYAKADIIIHTDDVRVGLTVDQIVRRVSPLLR